MNHSLTRTPLLIIFGLLFCISGCGYAPTAIGPDGVLFVYKKDTIRPTMLDTVKIVMKTASVQVDPDQEFYLARYNANHAKAEKKVPAVPKRSVEQVKQEQPKPSALASEADISAAKQRIADLKGTCKTGKNGGITAITLEASGNSVTLDDMKLFGRLKDLTSIDFTGSVFTDEYLAELKDLTNLTSVTINNSDIQNGTLEMLATLPELKKLDLRRDLKLDNTSLEILQKMPKLEELYILYNSFTNSGMNKVSKISTLKVVDVRGCPDISDNGAKYLAKLPEIEELYFRGVISNDGVEKLTAAPKLKFIEFQDCGDINSGSIESFNKMPALTGLRIFRCKGFDDATLQGIAGIPFERLELRDLNLSNAGILACKGKETLKTVELSELGSVNEDGMNELLASWKSPTVLRFFSIPVGDAELELIANNMPNLTELQLRAITVLITDKGIGSILKLKNLEILDLRENEKLSAESILKLSELKNLKRLYVAGTGIVTKENEAAFESLKQALPKCNITR